FRSTKACAPRYTTSRSWSSPSTASQNTHPVPESADPTYSSRQGAQSRSTSSFYREGARGTAGSPKKRPPSAGHHEAPPKPDLLRREARNGEATIGPHLRSAGSWNQRATTPPARRGPTGEPGVPPCSKAIVSA